MKAGSVKVRTLASNKQSSLRRYKRLILIIVSVLGLIAPSSFSAALEPDTQPSQLPDSSQEAPTVQLIDSSPQATSSEHLRADSRLAWTPTGTGEIQDRYSIVVARSAQVDGTGRLTDEVIITESNIESAYRDVTPLAEGQYYWQVQACPVQGDCRAWPQPWRVSIDLTVPVAPIAAVTSGLYDKTVEVSGSAEPGSTVQVSANGKECVTTVTENGTWECTFAEPFEYGEYDGQVTSSDAAGNASTLALPFSVKELFVATQITQEELPAVLEVVPIDETFENQVLKQPISVADVTDTDVRNDETNVVAEVRPLSVDGGLVQSSDTGWQVLGVPWFLWAGIGGVVSAGWFMSSGRLSRSFS